MTTRSDHDRPLFGPKRIFKRLKISELSLVDDPCVPGSDVVVVKAKTKGSTGTGESGEVVVEAPGGSSAFDAGTAIEAVRKRLEPYEQLVQQLDSSLITHTAFKARADSMAAALTLQAEAGGDPVAKRASRDAATIITETTMSLAAIQTALEAAEAKQVVLEGENTVLKAKVPVLEAENTALKGKLTAADAALALAQEAVTKAKPKTAEELDEEVLKGLPDGVRAELVASRTASAKTELDEAVGKAKKAGVKDADAVGAALVAIRKGRAKPEHAEVIEKALAAAGKALDGASLFKAAGSAAAVEFEGDPEAVIKAKAVELKTAKPSMTEAEAYDAAVSACPDAYAAYVQKRRK